MADYDIFNGDADGLCAIHQLRLAKPRPSSKLITGVKRDIALIAQVPLEPGARLRVCDISLRVNIKSVAKHLELGNHILYFDHHQPGDYPQEVAGQGILEAHIDTGAETCSSYLVDAYLGGRSSLWAMVGAYGDNQEMCARKLNTSLPKPLEDQDSRYLRQLGQLLNYNAYGRDRDDLVYQPEEILAALDGLADPWQLMESSEIPRRLCESRIEDRRQAEEVRPTFKCGAGSVLSLPDESWARRVIGDYANNLARREPGQAHAVALDNGDGTLCVSIRAPLRRPFHADELARRFGGGGRPKASGINALPQRRLAGFQRSFADIFG